MSLTITIPGAVNATTGATAPATLTVGVGVPGATGATGPAGVGVPTGGTAGQFLYKVSNANYDTDWNTINLSAYLTTANAATTYQTLSGMSSYLTTSTAASTYLAKSGGYITGDINSNNGSAYRSYDGTVYTSVLSPSLLQLNKAGGGGGAISVEWDGITFPSGKQTVHYPGTSILNGYATEYWVTSGFAPIAAGQPASGTVGQVLTKNSGTNYDSSWQTLVPGDRYLTSSTTSLTIGTGAKTLTVGTGLSYSTQQDIVIAYDAANHMHAVVTSYNSGTGSLVVDVQNKTGSGTYATWVVNVGGTVPLQSVNWGEIVGTLGNQTDLATALNAKLDTSTAASTYAPLSGAVFTGEVSTPASTTSSAGFSIAPGVAPSAPTNGEIWNSGTDLLARIGGVSETLARQSWVTTQLGSYLTTATASSTYQTISGMSSYLTTSAASTTYAALAGATFTGLVSTPASTTTTAGLRVAHGAAPTTPTNGDIWTTTAGLFARINGGTQQYAPLGSTNTFTGTNTFSGGTLTFGNATGASTIGIGTGATAAATTLTINVGTGATVATGIKNINIGTAGLASSNTNIAIGSTTGTNAITINGPTTLAGNLTATGGTVDLGNSTGATTVSLGGGATLTATTKTVNVGTAGAAGSTTAINIGGTAGTSTTTLNGTTNGVTLAADTNTTGLATTAYVVGQAGSATPLVDGTAAVGTSLRYARQDHVHPTDTSRAPLASPTFTGTVTIPAGASISGFAPLASPTFTGVPAAPTAAVDTNTTQVATTAYVVGQGYLKSATASTTYAPLASPALTGTPTAPTATAGTNTTQIATTAFVTAAVPMVATETQALAGTSSTTTITPLLLRHILSNAGYTAYTSLVGNYSSYVSGSGSVATLWSNFVGLSVTAANGKVAFLPNSQVSYHSILSRGKAELNLDWTKPFWLSFRFCYSSAATFGDTNTVMRVSFGKLSSYFGDLTDKGFGVKWTGGSAGAFTIMAHNGTTLTTSASAVTISNTTYFPTTSAAADFLVYSDGAGNVTLYCNGTQVATTTGGPSSGTTAGPRFTFEADNTTSTSGNVNCDFTGIRSMLAY